LSAKIHRIECVSQISGSAIKSLEKYDLYIDELLKWSSSINLVHEKSRDEIIQRHILDSLQLVDYINKDNDKIVDIGTGAGLPGMILAIAGVKSVRLIEPTQKKVVFLNHIKNIYSLNVTITNSTWKKINDCDSNLILSRAFTSLNNLLGAMTYVSRETSSPMGIFLKGEKLETEISEAKENWNFNYEIYQSLTHEKGKIIKVWGVKKSDC
jgi:16S rRNA (guanine527-N7)-methyltransferase